MDSHREAPRPPWRAVGALAVLLGLAPALLLAGEWSTERRLSRTDGQVGQTAVAVTGCTVYVAWLDNSEFFWKVFFARSRDGGTTWSQARRVAVADENSIIGLALAADGRRVHLAWQQYRSEGSQIFYQRSVNRGRSWRPAQLLSDQAFENGSPTIAADGRHVYVAWRTEAGAEGLGRLRFARSANRGRRFDQDWMTGSTAAGWAPLLAVSEDRLHFVYGRSRPLGNGEWQHRILHRQSDSHAVHWSGKRRVPKLPGAPVDLTVEGDRIQMVLASGGYKTSDSRHHGSADGGRSWTEGSLLNRALSDATTPTVAATGEHVYAAWIEDWFEFGPLLYRRSSDGGQTWSDVDQIVEHARGPALVAVAEGQACAGDVHLAYGRYLNLSNRSRMEIFYRRTSPD